MTACCKTVGNLIYFLLSQSNKTVSQFSLTIWASPLKSLRMASLFKGCGK